MRLTAKNATVVSVLIAALLCANAVASEDGVAALADEVREKGWLAYGARADNGTWDLFVSRPDGSGRRNITNTADYEEAAPRFSADGSRLMYRRLEKGATINHDRWGFQGQLILAHADGSNPVALGAEGKLAWATASADGRQIACLTKTGILILDTATKETVRALPRKGIYQQLFWSPDGRWFCGTGNHMGQSWTVVRMDAASGELNAVRSFQNCTPDWFPDSKRIVLSSRPEGQPAGNGYGYTQLWMADGDGEHQRLIYGEDGFHIYGGGLSPDGRYAVFTKAGKDGGGADSRGAPICLMRMSDARSIGGASPDLRAVHPDTKDGPVLELDTGWEPHWTYVEIFAGAAE